MKNNMNSLYLWRYSINGRRCGELIVGLFAATEEELHQILEEPIQLVEGDIYYEFRLSDFQKIELPQDCLQHLLKEAGSRTICGTNPIVEYYWGLEYECSDCGNIGDGTDFSTKDSPLDSLGEVPKCNKCKSPNIEFKH